MRTSPLPTLEHSSPDQLAPDVVVSLQGLTKRYGEHTAVDHLSLNVRRGEIFGILGTNGAGKTTSVECAQGLRRPTTGSVRVLGLDPITERSALAGRVGSQLQDSNLPDRLRVREAVWLFAESETAAQRVMEDWKLNDIARQPFGALSGGQRQRLFLALALLNQPEVVFLDELTQGLDPDARRSVWRLIERVRDSGTTVVLVTHFTEEAEVLCDRLAVMTNGKRVAEGTPSELIDRFSGGVRVRFAGGSHELAWARLVPGVANARLAGDDVESTGDPTIVGRIGHELVERGMATVAVRVHQPTLEEALLNIIAPEEVAT